MELRRVTLACALSLAASPARAGAQEVSVQQCIDSLSAPTRDSVRLLAVLTVHTVGQTAALPGWYQSNFGEAVQKHLKLPRPLGAHVYAASNDTVVSRTANLTMRGDYDAMITPQGRIVRVSTIGGAQDEIFDGAVLAAMRAIDSADHLSLVSGGLPNADVAIRVTVLARPEVKGTEAFALEPVIVSTGTLRWPDISAMQVDLDSAVETPLFAFRVPLRRVVQFARHIPGGHVSFPEYLRRAGVEGEVTASFVVGWDGQAEPGSSVLTRGARSDLAEPVRKGLPTQYYIPMLIGTCSVRTVVQESFWFKLPASEMRK